MDTLVIRDIRFDVSVGVYAHKKTRRQFVTVDLEIGLRDGAAAPDGQGASPPEDARMPSRVSAC